MDDRDWLQAAVLVGGLLLVGWGVYRELTREELPPPRRPRY